MGAAVGFEALMIGSTVFKTFSQMSAADSEVDALKMQRTQEQLSAANKNLQTLSQVQKVVSAQNVMGAARGITADSASLATVQQDTFDNAARDEKIADLNEQAKLATIDQNIANTRTKETAAIFGNLFDLASATTMPRWK